MQLEETSIAVRMMFFVFSILSITFFLYTGTSVDIKYKDEYTVTCRKTEGLLMTQSLQCIYYVNQTDDPSLICNT